MHGALVNRALMNTQHIGPGPLTWDGLPPDAETWVADVLARTGVASLEEVAGVRLVRDGRKRLAHVRLATDKELVLKQYRDREGVQTNLALQRLADAGLAAPGRFRVTLALGWDDDNLTQVTERASGLDWGTWFDREPKELRRASSAVADWITTLQQLPILLPDQTEHRSPARLMREARELADLYPDHAATVLDTARQAADALSVDAESLVPSHGDLHLDEVFISDDPQPVVTVVDLDTAGARRPSDDIGFALAMVLVSSRLRTGSFVPGATAGLALWTRWALTGPDQTAVPSQMVRSLVMSLHLELVAYAKDRGYLLPLWLDLASAALASGVEGALKRAGQIG